MFLNTDVNFSDTGSCKHNLKQFYNIGWEEGRQGMDNKMTHFIQTGLILKKILDDVQKPIHYSAKQSKFESSYHFF